MTERDAQREVEQADLAGEREIADREEAFDVRLRRDELLERCEGLAQENPTSSWPSCEEGRPPSRFAGPDRCAEARLSRHREPTAPAGRVSVAVHGQSSAGKSHAIKQALAFHPPEAYKELTSMSDKALFYSKDEFSHRMLVVFESAGIVGDFFTVGIRTLLSEGRLRYEVTDIETHSTIKIDKDGPTGLITSTAQSVDRELGTRVLLPTVGDEPELTTEILVAQATAATGRKREEVDYGPYQALQRLLQLGVCDVVVPFAETIAAETDPASVRVRRDFPATISVVMAHALLHAESRDRDLAGRVIATPIDYRAAYDLVAPLLAEASARTVPTGVRSVVEAVKNLEEKDGWGKVTIAEAAAECGRDRTTATRHVTRALGMGYLVDTNNGQGKRGRRRLLESGDPLPEDGGVLPAPEILD